jgi:hypothetical protein
MQKYLLIFVLTFASFFAKSAELAPPDSIGISRIENLQNIDNLNITMIEPLAPGKIPSFWWSFVISAIGTYFMYTIALAPLSVLIVYIAAKRNKAEVNKSLWGMVAGVLVGVGLFIVFKLL